MLAAPVASRGGVILFQDNFDTDASAGNWSFNSEVTGDVAQDGILNEADYFFDYSTVGIPSAPNSVGGTTRGLRMQANVPSDFAGRFSGASTSPLNQSFTGDYVLRMDVWQNFPGPFPAGGAGSTQMTMAGVGTNGTNYQFPGGPNNTNMQGVGFAASGDGGTGQDYRIYTSVGAPRLPSTGDYNAGTQDPVPNDPSIIDSRNNISPYYAASGFGGETAPAEQLALFSSKTGATAPGTQGMAWHEWVITKVGDRVSWSIDGVPIGSTTKSLTNENIFLGHFDVNGTRTTPELSPLLFGLFDNVRVEVIPEPGALSLLAAGGLLALRRRRN